MAQLNQAGLDLIKSFESCRLQAYQDQGGVWTIGWGSTGSDVGPGLVWSQEEADQRLMDGIQSVEEGINTLVSCDLTDNQFSALVCFAYNVGVDALAQSTLLRDINAGDFDAAANEFLRWDKVRGAMVPGLLRRRLAEKALFTQS